VQQQQQQQISWHQNATTSTCKQAQVEHQGATDLWTGAAAALAAAPIPSCSCSCCLQCRDLLLAISYRWHGTHTSACFSSYCHSIPHLLLLATAIIHIPAITSGSQHGR
jgi:hypothetical protein